MLETNALPLEKSPAGVPRPMVCSAPGCKSPVPAELATEGFCVVHLTFQVEQACSRLRCEIARGAGSPESKSEITTFLAGTSILLARVASGVSLSDDKKRRVLNTFLTIMILRETLERATQERNASIRRQAALFPSEH